ncbi:unnamed protein product [Triticum turgidum subsp. durum]|uniref:Zinc knuckle CX2CX4HX4C domain-containing protein n=1 Tax=Triticum turgidum subsp. durum TaxID=4567 RepID=A0A9R0RKU9_TRITD|nr:unnamed protein product [Triticum turgidum subsp. durum]
MRPFSHAALLNSMRNAWACAQGVTFNIKGPNLFLAQCHCLRDWKRVMEGGPWQFRRDPVLIVEYDGFTNVSEYALDMYPIWARIKVLSDGLTRKRELAEKVAKKLGGPPFTVVVNEGTINPSSHLNVRVFVNVQKPLVSFVHITLKEMKRYPVTYEKLPDFCYFCRCMGHVVEECGDGIHDPADCDWGDWLHWANEPVISGGGGGRGRGWSAAGQGSGGARGASRGGGRGGGGLGGRGGVDR